MPKEGERPAPAAPAQITGITGLKKTNETSSADTKAMQQQAAEEKKT